MKKNMIYILALLIGGVISYLLKEIMGLPTNLAVVLIPNIVGLGSAWLYFTVRKNKKK